MRSLPYRVQVMDHARYRARERFPGFKTARIIDEVRDALAYGRISSRRPHGLAPPDDPQALYVWTPDGSRVYALHHSDTGFYVMTTLRPDFEVARAIHASAPPGRIRPRRGAVGSSPGS